MNIGLWEWKKFMFKEKTDRENVSIMKEAKEENGNVTPLILEQILYSAA
jgi:hypothetical protein